MMSNMSFMFLFLLLFRLLFGAENVKSGCSWSGHMPGPLLSSSCPTITSNSPKNCTVTPSYESISNIWACPNGNNSNAENVCSCANKNTCVEGSDTNALCNFDVTEDNPGCCCALEGCDVTPQFNWIISTCQGSGCGAYSDASELQGYKDMGSQVILNYAASYQWNSGQQQWIMDEDSSFNTDGSRPPMDLVKPFGGLSDVSEAWLAPQPGGAADWSWGYYPAGVKGVGPPGIMFVMSTTRSWNMAWYMLNQITLDRGPSILYPSNKCAITNNNCWSAGNAGEIDFLESPWTVNAGSTDDYRRLYATQWNQIGRCFIGQEGATCNADGGWFSEDLASNNYFLGSNPNEDAAYVWVAVVDSVGTFIYRIPGDEVEDIWPGLTTTTASCTLQNRPSKIPTNSGPPCTDSTPYCALFLPNCQSTNWGGAKAGQVGGANEGCKTTSVQGWCNNWWRLFDNTNQWLWPSGGKYSVTQFQYPAPAVEQPWYIEMESFKVDWNGSPQYNAGCCVLGQGHCPTTD